ncbi:MAG: AAA family ATPase, partial [Terriglobia bacterium]
VKPLQASGKPKLLSVLLYGPPGTSKTSIMESLAHKLGWQFLAVSPADFLGGGGEQIEARSTIVFEILNRAKRFVVLFDEVDEFLIDRDSKKRPEGILRFMTTSMLPKLQALRSRENIIFALATNYSERLDKAITRLGRVDDSWGVLPPDLTSRIALAQRFRADIPYKEAHDIATHTPFFSYRELQNVVKERARRPRRRRPWEETDHPPPTASPGEYRKRPGADKELQGLLSAQITEDLCARVSTKTKGKLLEQLNEIKKKQEQLEPFDDETLAVIEAKLGIFNSPRRP